MNINDHKEASLKNKIDKHYNNFYLFTWDYKPISEVDAYFYSKEDIKNLLEKEENFQDCCQSCCKEEIHYYMLILEKKGGLRYHHEKWHGFMLMASETNTCDTVMMEHYKKFLHNNLINNN